MGGRPFSGAEKTQILGYALKRRSLEEIHKLTGKGRAKLLLLSRRERTTNPEWSPVYTVFSRQYGQWLDSRPLSREQLLPFFSFLAELAEHRPATDAECSRAGFGTVVNRLGGIHAARESFAAYEMAHFRGDTGRRARLIASSVSDLESALSVEQKAWPRELVLAALSMQNRLPFFRLNAILQDTVYFLHVQGDVLERIVKYYTKAHPPPLPANPRLMLYSLPHYREYTASLRAAVLAGVNGVVGSLAEGLAAVVQEQLAGLRERRREAAEAYYLRCMILAVAGEELGVCGEAVRQASKKAVRDLGDSGRAGPMLAVLAERADDVLRHGARLNALLVNKNELDAYRRQPVGFVRHLTSSHS